METNKKKTKVTHKPHSIRFTDKAIDELKYRNNFNHRQNVRFVDGPPGVTLRWTPKTNKKIFQIEGKCKGHSFRMDIGQFYLGSYGTLEVNSKLLPIFKKHKRPDGTWKSNPKVALTTLDELNESQRCTVNEVIELIVEQNFPRRRISGNLALLKVRLLILFYIIS